MKYLLDTNILIWYIDDPSQLSYKVTKIMDDINNTFVISIVSIWEIVIKMCIKRLSLSVSINDLFEILEYKNISIIPIKKEILEINLDLPLHHKDPFDRILIATTYTENTPIITSDKDIQLYDINWVW